MLLLLVKSSTRVMSLERVSWRRVVGSNPIWSSDFFPSFHLMLKPYHVVISSKDSLGWLDGCISDMP